MQKEIQWILKEKYHGKQTVQFKKDVKRFKKGEPVDYIIGFKYFLGCKIDLSKKPLIPRPETEFWASKVLDEVKNGLLLKKSSEDVKSVVNKSWGHESYALKALDIFAGSGCVGIAILANTQNLLPAQRSLGGVGCDFADIDKNNISQIKINLKTNFIDEKKCKVIKSDIFSKIKNKYDFILANPPYIPTTQKSKVQKSVLKYEPKIALFAGKDGMKFINKFLKQAKKHLNKNGEIFMEFDSPQKTKIEFLLKKNKYKTWQFFKDQNDKYRWVSVS